MAALQSGKSFRKLRTDLDNRHNWGNQETKKQSVSKESADGQRTGSDLARASVHDYGADNSHQQTGR